MKEITKSNKGAINALKGYRVQALFSICYILEAQNPNLSYIPEGLEDLDICNQENQLLKLNQVKNTVNSLVLSDLISKKGTSFFMRSIEAFDQGKRPKLRVACFGTIGPELMKLFSDETDQQEFNKRFTNYELNEEQLLFLKTHTSLESLNENEYQNRAIQLLKQKAVAVDSIVAIDYLHFWLYHKSEKGGTITQESLLAKVNDIGRFVDERQNFHKHLHTSIRLIDGNDISSDRLFKLSRGFYEGVAAKYDHIRADLDVIRYHIINQLEDSFEDKSVVIVHGASGQGKSTLAYRYIFEYYSILAYEIVLLETLQLTLEQIQALKAISKSLEIPILIYIDVQPGNQNWTQLVSELAHSKVFKFLITIREEDWNRTSNKGVDFSFTDLELNLRKNEAQEIYTELNQKSTDRNFTDFEEAWVFFGGQGPLLEFTHLITQGKTLKARLESQLDRIENENPDYVSLLKIVGTADSFGSKVSLQKIENTNILPQLRLALKILEKEFLVKLSEDGQWLTGLHPIRSKIVTNILHTSDSEKKNTIIELLELTNPSDLFSLLTNTFIQLPKHRTDILLRLNQVRWKSFVALNEIVNSLNWLGLKTLVEQHQELLKDFYAQDNLFMGVRAYFDFTGTMNIDSFIEYIEGYRDTLKEQGEKLNSLGISKDQTFNFLKNWIHQVKVPPLIDIDERELEAFGGFLYWLGNQAPHRTIELEKDKIKGVIKTLPVKTSAAVLFGLHNYNDDSKSIANDCEEVYLEVVRDKFQIALLERDSESIRAHFLIDIFSEVEEDGNIAHRKKLQILDALRYGLPYLKKHECQGHGHKMYLLPVSWDDSKVSIEISNSPVRYMVQLNATLFNIFIYDERPADWTDFTKEVLVLRKRLIAHFQKLVLAFEEYYRKKRNSTRVKDFAIEDYTAEKNNTSYSVLFPQNISDPLGLISEGEKEGLYKSPQNEETFSIFISKFKEYKKVHNSFFGALHTFGWQSSKVILDHHNLTLEKQPGLKRASLVNITEAFQNVESYQSTFRKYFEKYAEADQLAVVEEHEREIITSLLYNWKHYVQPSQLYKKAARKEAVKTFQKLKADFEKKLTKECEKVTEHSDFSIILGARFDILPKVVIITLDISSALDIGEGIQYVIQVLKNAIGSCKSLSFKYTILEMYYPEFWVIPTVLYELFQPNAYKLKLYQFALDIGDGQVKINDFEEIDPKVIELLQIDELNDQTGMVLVARDMVKSFQELTLKVGVLSQLLELDQKRENVSDKADLLIVKIKDISRQAGDAFSELTATLPKQHDFFSETQERRNTPELDLEYLEILMKTYKMCLPIENMEAKEKLELSLRHDQVLNWKERLESLDEDILTIYIYLIHLATNELGTE